MWGSSWPQTDAGAQVVVPDIVKTTGVRTGGCYDENLVSHRFKVGAKVHAAFDGDDALFCRFNTDMAEDRLIQTLAPRGTNDDANVRRRIQYPQDHHGTKVGGNTAKHVARKCEFTVAKRFYPEAALKGILTILTGLATQERGELSPHTQFVRFQSRFRVIQQCQNGATDVAPHQCIQEPRGV